MALNQRSYRVPPLAGLGAGARELLASSPGLPMQLLTAGALLYLVATEGGYFQLDWYPVALGVLALLAVWAAFVTPGVERDRRAVAATALLWLFAAWALVSIAWADDRSVAWEGGNRALFYAALYAQFVLWPMPPRQARWLLAVFGLGIAAIGAVELLRWAAAADPAAYTDGGRFSEPVGYHNGNVALWAMGAFACLWIGYARGYGPVVRGLALGAVPLLAGLALLGQSRASFFAVPAALLVMVVAARERLRLLVALAAAAAAVAVAAGPILDVVDASGGRVPPGLVDNAARAILLPSLVLAALGALAALAELRRPPSAQTVRRAGTAAKVLVAVLALVALALGVVRAGDIRAEISERWDQFKTSEPAGEGVARLGSGGTNRYEFWTVAWDAFEREPLLGVGMDNFQQDYLERGETFEKPRFPHSVELAVLSGTGLIGTLLLGGGLVLALLAALRARARLPGAEAGVVAAALGVFAYLWAHASVDWLYEMPGLGGVAFAALGLAAGSCPPEEQRAEAPPSLAVRLLPVLLAALSAASIALPWMAERQIERAVDTWRVDPASAYERLDHAGDLNPLSAQPGLFEGEIALKRGEPDRAEAAFQEVIRREPRNAHAWLELAVIASMRQDRPSARERIRRAHELSPRDEAIRVARQAIIAENRRITHEEVISIVLENARGAAE
jgi:tetratricopeptide (TPR) repeat protein